MTMPAPGRHIVWLNWDSEFLPWFRGQLRDVERDGERVELPAAPKPGQHWALTGKTREGKTTFAAGIMRERKYVLALDPKGEDDTLAATGFTRILGVPPHKKFPKEIQRDLDEEKPVRLIVGGGSRTAEQDAKLRKLLDEAIEYARQSGGWTLYVDEYQILGDQRMFRLGPNIERMLISAARDKTTVITAFQAPAWVPKASTRQSTFIVMWRTKDRDMLKAVARAAGRDWREIGQIVDSLEKYVCLIISDDVRAPMLMTTAPKIN